MRARIVGLPLMWLGLMAAGAWAQERGTVIEKTAYAGWPNCYRVTNGTAELIATTDVGPRVIRLGFVGGDNEFHEFPDDSGKTGGDAWRPFGGHRLWHSPEVRPRTYAPDNSPIEAKVDGDWLRLLQPTEPSTGIRKEMHLHLDATGGHVTVVHRLTNHNLWAVELAPWALSMMAQGGFAVIPQEPRAEHGATLLPARPLVLWPYTDMADPRWTWGQQVILLRQDPNNPNPTKAGYGNSLGWLAYARAGNLFVTRFTPVAGATYPDLGSSCETFTNNAMLEIETVGPLVMLEPGATVEHVEEWHLFRGVAVNDNEADVAAKVLPKVAETQSK